MRPLSVRETESGSKEIEKERGSSGGGGGGGVGVRGRGGGGVEEGEEEEEKAVAAAPEAAVVEMSTAGHKMESWRACTHVSLPSLSRANLEPPTPNSRLLHQKLFCALIIKVGKAG